jgi:uncharacterized protein (TIGR02284 family)
MAPRDGGSETFYSNRSLIGKLILERKMTIPQYDVDRVNDLIKIMIDNVDGYRETAIEAIDKEQQSILFDRANRREEIVERLQDYVESLGAAATDDGTVIAGAKHIVMQLQGSVIEKHAEKLVAEIEDRENVLRNKFGDAATDQDLSPRTTDVIQQCLDLIRSTYAEHTMTQTV